MNIKTQIIPGVTDWENPDMADLSYRWKTATTALAIFSTEDGDFLDSVEFTVGDFQPGTEFRRLCVENAQSHVRESLL